MKNTLFRSGQSVDGRNLLITLIGDPTNDDPGECYEVHAVRYANMPRRRRDNFMSADDHDGPMPMDFFVWLLKSSKRTILVDTGFNAQAAERRQRTPILAVTASAFEDQERKSHAVGMDGLITKPIGIEQLRATLAPEAREQIKLMFAESQTQAEDLLCQIRDAAPSGDE